MEKEPKRQLIDNATTIPQKPAQQAANESMEENLTREYVDGEEARVAKMEFWSKWGPFVVVGFILGGIMLANAC